MKLLCYCVLILYLLFQLDAERYSSDYESSPICEDDQMIKQLKRKKTGANGNRFPRRKSKEKRI